jgi:HEAT repeat protein
MAALALGDIGSAAKRGVPALIKVLKDEHEGVRRRVVVALGESWVKCKKKPDLPRYASPVFMEARGANPALP